MLSLIIIAWFVICGCIFGFLLLLGLKVFCFWLDLLDALFLYFGLDAMIQKTRLTSRMHFFRLIFGVKVLCFGWCTYPFSGVVLHFDIA